MNHSRPARSNRAWRTPVQGDVGFSDLVLAKDSCVIFAELKYERGRMRPEQIGWVGALSGADGCDDKTVATVRRIDDGGWVAVVVWRPRDWASGVVESVLVGDARPAGNLGAVVQ